ncbi:tyrosine-protein phosphatase [Lysinibacillus sp. NPDC058147]|uniref:tyrosine-protein phosphatase n=1 Tax=unclassified Lysinibacillus TaxID=2636778 RepID=UPI0036D96DE6
MIILEKVVIVMIDMHTHILYCVDDGPRTEEESLQMLKQAVKEGITEIISTSHALKPQFHVDYATVVKQLDNLRELIEHHDIPLTLHTGQEVRINNHIDNLFTNNQLHVLANSKYVLIELPSNIIPSYTNDLMTKLLIAGYTPIIAHPERNRAIAENPSRLEILIRNGAFAQITAGSLSGHFGKKIQKFSLELVRSNYVHTYGSDVHNLTTRPFHFEKGLRYLEKKKELDTVDILLENNKRIISNQPLILYEPVEIKRRGIF